ncbi:leucine-rich repeat domain-containing protein [Prevotella disiens]|uniref:Leucine-rich repeat domain-containing protein n=1 Tax=Prevotella disiens TaxID=28130 RepID=A0A3E4QL06_9BACT|nr:leucine-rich repeat domain-containing protein [Prevotella disiens]RGL02256.1 leucine-rich repeat domain-containing protein [Prevotella disiens]
MKKFYLLLIICSMFFASARAEIGEGVIKIKTDKLIGENIKMDILIYGGLDEEGEVRDEDPTEGKNISFEGATVTWSSSMKIILKINSPEITIRGKVDYLSIVNQKLVEIDVNKADELYELRINENPIQSLDINQAPKLKVLWASYCKELSDVKMDKADKITSISLQGTKISSIDLSNKPLITNLNLGENPHLKSIDVTMLPLLEELWINANGIKSLDVSKNPKLNHLECSRNKLTELDVTNNTKLESFFCWGNQIKDESMDKLIASLVQESGDTEREFCVYNKLYADEGNVLTEEQAAAVKTRGWIPKQATGSMEFFMWEEYEGVPTGIENLTIQKEDKGAWYDLNGRRIEKPSAKGIYIHNGKKILIK